ncbi:MAG: terminase family protein [Planctomycetota bacterium]|nr:terminase family protein [Planctomycetota bacterium]
MSNDHRPSNAGGPFNGNGNGKGNGARVPGEGPERAASPGVAGPGAGPGGAARLDLPHDLSRERLLPKQRAVFDCPARIRVAVCGRRFGKTTLGEVEAASACARRGGSLVWWVAAAQAQAQRSYRRMFGHLEHESWLKKKECGRFKRLHFYNDSALEFVTAGSGDRLRGAGLDFLVVDEAADVPEEVWSSVLRPALVDRPGRALVLGTPRGRGNWLHRLYRQGTLPEFLGRVQSFRFRTDENPRIDRRDLDDSRLIMSEDEFKQEFEAEFVESGGAVFKHFHELAGEVLRTRGDAGARYATGVDIGRRNDATVAVTLRRHARGPAKMEGLLVLEKSGWQEQFERLKDHVDRFPGPVTVDATGLGDPIVEALGRACPHVEGFTFTELRKAQLINDLQIAFATRALRLAPDPRLLSELETYEVELEPPGRRARHFPRYNAARGHHDDHVIALALAWRTLHLRYGPPAMDEAWIERVQARPFREGLFG